MKRYTNIILDDSIERINQSNILNGNEFLLSRYLKCLRLYFHNKNLRTTTLIFKGNNKECCEFLSSLCIYLLANKMTNN